MTRKVYKIEKPDLTKFQSRDAINKIFDDALNAKSWVYKASYPEYLYWDKVKHMKFQAKDVSQEEVWFIIKTIRDLESVNTPVKSEDGRFFTWKNNLPGLEAFFHHIDLNTGGSLFSFTRDMDDKLKYKFISRGILEEAIASSQLEGANTTRKVAKQFIREGRAPVSDDEQMILNNYNAMKEIEGTLRDKELSQELLFELHSMIVSKTVKNEECGRYRNDTDDIVVSDKKNPSIIYHVPPKEKFLYSEMEKLIRFANDNQREKLASFMHPVIKAIILHFWVGYLHPFTDGNGRIARLLFYWYLLKHDYWAFAYLPISQIIKNTQVQYRNAYVYSEQDDCDMTYFITYKINKIKLAVNNFNDYLKSKAKENKRMNHLGKDKYNLNDRQIQLLQYFIDDKNSRTTPKTYTNINKISKKTGLTDLKGLEKHGFLDTKKVGRNTFYFATAKINELFHLE